MRTSWCGMGTKAETVGITTIAASDSVFQGLVGILSREQGQRAKARNSDRTSCRRGSYSSLKR